MPTARTRKPSSPNGASDLVAAFSYFRTPEILGGDGEFTLALDSATDRLETAWRCETWGEFARHLGLTWADFVKERHEEIAEISSSTAIRATTRLAFGELWGNYAVVGDIEDPRRCAYDFLMANVPQTVRDEPRLHGVIDWGGSSPGGTTDAVTSPRARGFVMLREVLHAGGFTGLSLKRADNPLAFLEFCP